MNRRDNETQVAYHRRRFKELMNLRTPWEPLWEGLATHIEPSRLRTQTRDGDHPRDRSKILDSTGTFAYRTLASGMHSGITSPARPWFRLTMEDRDLVEYGPVKEYVTAVEKLMRSKFAASNIYTGFHTGYGDQGQFGQSCALLVEDQDKVIRMQTMMHGRFWLARDEQGRATTLYRKFSWSVQRIVSRFGLDKVSSAVRSKYDTSDYDAVFNICHAVEPRMDRNPASPAKTDMAFLSNYWEDDNGDKADQLLEESGFASNPIIAPAWELPAEDHYAISPGMIALGDIKMLQKEQARKLEAIDKMVRPPMTGPTSMRNNPNSLLPGSITYVDDPNRVGYRPAMEVRLSLSDLQGDIRETRDRINQAFYADLFLMLANMEGIQPRNSMEIAERKEEKLLALGPVLENIYAGQLAPVIDRTFEIMSDRGMLPPPPPELEGQELEIEYISILAQAQKAISTGAIERGLAFVGNLAAIKPDIIDKIDVDQAVDEYGDAIGMPPSIIRSDDDVAAMRADRAKQQQAAQAAEMAATVAPAMKQGAEAAQLMAETDSGPGGSSLLQRIGLN